MPNFPRLCLILCVAASPLSAQIDEVATRNLARVRLLPLSADSRSLVGVPVSVSADTIQLILNGTTDTIDVAMKTLRGIEEFRGRRSNWDRGALIGGIVLGIGGAIAAPLISAAMYDGGGVPGDGELVPLGFAAGALAGGVLGAGIGALSSRERWSARPIVGVRRGAARDRVDLGLGLAFTF